MTGKDIVARLNKAKDALKAKGYTTPSVEIGCKVLGEYGAVFWAAIHLGSPKNWIDNYTDESLDKVLESIDRSVEAIPLFAVQVSARAAALGKLSVEERRLLEIPYHY
jgi:hypothetical protein